MRTSQAKEAADRRQHLRQRVIKYLERQNKPVMACKVAKAIGTTHSQVRGTLIDLRRYGCVEAIMVTDGPCEWRFLSNEVSDRRNDVLSESELQERIDAERQKRLQNPVNLD